MQHLRSNAMSSLTRSFRSLLLGRTRLLSSSTTSSQVAKSKPPQRKHRRSGDEEEEAPSPSSPTPSVERKERVMRPMEVPWQAKVCNNVHLIGLLGEALTPVTSKDGVLHAVSFLVHKEEKVVPPFWIPIIFRGELAEAALLHLKENDHIYVTGELSADESELQKTNNSSHQVLVHTINFIKELIPKKEVKEMHEKMDGISEGKEMHKKMDGISGQSEKRAYPKKPRSAPLTMWQDLLNNPEAWMDYRAQKREGMVKPRYPDFKHKHSKEGLWSDAFPEWVSRQVGSLSFADPGEGVRRMSSSSKWGDNSSSLRNPPSDSVQNTSPSSCRGDQEWDDLLKNPDKWYDYRSTKHKPTYPDFKHKETGQGLWIGPTTPAWVTPKLPPAT